MQWRLVDGQNRGLNIRTDVVAVDVCIAHVCNNYNHHSSCEPGLLELQLNIKCIPLSPPL